jgi:histone-lysine N-methyltransferase SETD1
VAVRYRSTGNHIRVIRPSSSTICSAESDNASTRESCSSVEVWTDPIAGRDDGYALVGQRVRCIFPKLVLCFGEVESSPPARKEKISRILEGEVISIISQRRRRKRAQGYHGEIVVDLLIDRETANSVPYLPRTDQEDKQKIKNIGDAEKKRQKYEEIIRGKNKLSVRVTLSGKPAGDIKSGDLQARWAIRKQISVPPSSNNKSNTAAPDRMDSEPVATDTKETVSKQKPVPTNWYVGDGNDELVQQEHNWRWLAGRNRSLVEMGDRASDPDSMNFAGNEKSLLLGEVISMAASVSPLSSSTLATVTLRKLWLPEHIRGGRKSHHSALEVFGDNASLMKQGECHFQVPIEELIMLGKRLERRSGVVTNGQEFEGEHNATGSFFTSYSYSAKEDVLYGIGADTLISCASKNNDPYQKTKSNGEISKSVSLSTQCLSCIRPCETGGVTCTTCSRVMHSNCSCLEQLFLASMNGIDHKAGSNRMSISDSSLENVIALQTTRPEKTADTFKLLNGHAKSGVKDNLNRPLECLSCHYEATKQQPSEGLSDSVIGGSMVLHHKLLCDTIASVSPVDFDLPLSFFNPVPSSSSKPHKSTWLGRRRKHIDTKAGSMKNGPKTQTKRGRKKNHSSMDQSSNSPMVKDPINEKDYSVFKPTCSRLLSYDPQSKSHKLGSEGMPSGIRAVNVSKERSAPSHSSTSRRTNLRERGKMKEDDGKKLNSRAARASQRRMMKDVHAFGASSLGLDALAGREQQLRFGKSLIHGWGVFADEFISAGDVIVEYRGQLIGNAVAEKREKEYECAKIGSDYMFRMDSDTVCDATKLGNVARFINASCSPNCYTQIITLNGNKRIVIYAKRDIAPAEELCYDYKFDMEYDESKRVECHCASPECRGFMNWVSFWCLVIERGYLNDDPCATSHYISPNLRRRLFYRTNVT